MQTNRQIVASCALLWALCACSQAREENGGTDSTTHWLKRCNSAAECGGLACLCGVCNLSCTNDAQCSGLDANAVCEPTADSCVDSERSCAMGPEDRGPDMRSDSGAAGRSSDAAAGRDETIGPSCELTGDCSFIDASARADAGDADSGSVDGDVEVQSPEPTGAPLLERASAGDYTCTVSRPASTLPIDPQSATPAVAALDGIGHVFWVDGQTSGYDGPLQTAAVGLDGVLQTAHEVAAPDASLSATSPNVRVVAAHDRLTIWWSYNTSSAVDPFGALVQLDTDGNALAPSRSFDGTPYPYDATVVATETGYVAAWGEPTASGCDLTLLELDTNVEAVGAPKTLASLVKEQPTDGEFPACGVTTLVPTSSGYALVYERARSTGNILAYQAFDAEGIALAPATRLTPEDSWRYGASLLARGDQVLVAWSVMTGPNMGAHEVSATLRIARFGADGTLSGDVATLAAGSEFQTDAGAMWLDLGDQLGLAWTRDQKLAANCTEACLHSASVHYVVLDGTDLSPRGTPIAIETTGADSPGLGGQLLAQSGDDLLVLLSRWTYIDIQGSTGSLLPGTPASAAILCAH